MDKTWVLITDAERARCFERDATDHRLNELADFVHPHASLQGKNGHGRTGHAGTQFEPHTEAHAKERADFARRLADYLNKGISEQRCQALLLIATSPMLGEIKPHLSRESEKMLLTAIASDLTHYNGRELEKRVNKALRLPE